MTVALVMACAVFGLIFGSFSNVCVHRLPSGGSISHPRSRCPECGHAIAWHDNIPLISYLVLKGRCRYCGKPISMRYPLLELLMGASWAYLAWHFGPTPQLLMALTLITMLWILTFIDLETGLLPNAITLPGILIGFIFASWFGYFLDSLIGAIAGYCIFWLVARVFLLVTGREGMGYGDFKLLAMLGAFFGWKALPFIIFAAAASGSIVGGCYLLLAKKSSHSPVPFGPFLAAAGMMWLLSGPSLLNLYSTYFHL